MSVRVKMEPVQPPEYGGVVELCLICGVRTHYWWAKGCAPLCQACAKMTDHNSMVDLARSLNLGPCPTKRAGGPSGGGNGGGPSPHPVLPNLERLFSLSDVTRRRLRDGIRALQLVVCLNPDDPKQEQTLVDGIRALQSTDRLCCAEFTAMTLGVHNVLQERLRVLRLNRVTITIPSRKKST